MEVDDKLKDFKEKYDIQSVKELDLDLKDNNNVLEVDSCICVINQIVKNFEYYVSEGNEFKDVQKLFNIDYREVINDFMELYFTELVKDIYNISISTPKKVELINKVNLGYNLEKCNLKEVVNILNKEFKIAMNIDNKDIKQIDISKPKKQTIVKMDNYKNNNQNLDELKLYIKDRYDNLMNNFSQYSNFNKYKEEIEKEVKVSKKICRNTLVSDLSTDELYKAINHEINSLCNVIEMKLEKELEMNNCKLYINKLNKNGYLTDKEKKDYLTKLGKANNIWYIYNLTNDLYNKHFYPKKVKQVKDTLNKHFSHWMRKNPGEKYILQDYQKQIFEMLNNNYVSKDVLEKLENMGISGINSMLNKDNLGSRRSR